MSSSEKPPDIALKVANDGTSHQEANLSSDAYALEFQPINKPAAPKKLPFFKLPPEIRFMIYRMAWTVDPARHTIMIRGRYAAERNGQLRIAYVNEQLSLVAKLGAVSRQMRHEAYAEFFHRTQAYFRWNTQQQGFTPHNTQVMAKMKSSWLLWRHLQHVSLHWPENAEHRLSTFKWLEGLPQLKTLKIIIAGEPDLANRNGAHGVNALRRLAVYLARRNLRFEKPFVTFEAERPELVGMWSEVDWFRELVEEVARNDAEPPRQIIEQHLGCLNPWWAKSLVYRL
ncbi:hypothetical protein QBC45DRAFT_479195 [Copromyces sp. CBS 386.78]|nr:hypothetical protein QBC45DRAFT_479195 [Copromyces sp. CBS 386.78]